MQNALTAFLPARPNVFSALRPRLPPRVHSVTPSGQTRRAPAAASTENRTDQDTRWARSYIRLIVRFFACSVRCGHYSVLATEKRAFRRTATTPSRASAWGRPLGVVGDAWRDVRHRHHRRRRERLWNRQRRRRTRLVRVSLRERRSRLLDIQRFEQAHSRRPALSGAFRVSFGSRGARRARGPVANRAPYRVAASLCAAPQRGSQTRVGASDWPFSLRPSWRAPAAAADPDPATGR